MAETAASLWLGPFILTCLLPLLKSSGCPTICGDGLVLKGCKCVPCGHEEYWYKRSGQPRCERCISSCSDEENKVEVQACTNRSGRKCHCKPGFYCPSRTQMTCRRTCLHCKAGSYSSSNSLNLSCQPYTNCSSKGMVVIAEGSSTQDRVCGYRTTPSRTMTPIVPVTTSVPTTTSVPQTSSKPMTVLTTTIAVTTDAVSTMTTVLSPSIHPNPISTGQLQGPQYPTTSQPLPRVLKTAAYTSTSRENHSMAENGGSNSSSEPMSWMFLLLLVIFLLLMLKCLSMGCKAETLKSKLDWPGLTFGKYQLQNLQKPQGVALSTASRGSHIMEMPAANQQVTMENNGKGESINNTVGSIYIYSPGTVILGSNSNEKKEETMDCGEEMPLMSIPQQESSSYSEDDSVCGGMQEEFAKELSFPVPATSK